MFHDALLDSPPTTSTPPCASSVVRRDLTPLAADPDVAKRNASAGRVRREAQQPQKWRRSGHDRAQLNDIAAENLPGGWRRKYSTPDTSTRAGRRALYGDPWQGHQYDRTVPRPFTAGCVRTPACAWCSAAGWQLILPIGCWARRVFGGLDAATEASRSQLRSPELPPASARNRWTIWLGLHRRCGASSPTSIACNRSRVAAHTANAPMTQPPHRLPLCHVRRDCGAYRPFDTGAEVAATAWRPKSVHLPVRVDRAPRRASGRARCS